MKDQKMAESLDGKCPYCGSDYVVKKRAFGDHYIQMLHLQQRFLLPRGGMT
jgi:hypothetical protein